MLKRLKLFYVLKILSSLFTQFVSLFLVYLFSPEEYGYLALVISISQLMFILTSGWTNGAIINLGSKFYSEKKTYIDIVYHRIVIVLISFLFVTILFFCFENSIENFLFVADNFKLTYILFLGYIMYDFTSQLLYPANKDVLQSSLELFASIIIFIVVFFFVRTVSNYVFVYTSAYFVFAIIVGAIFVSHFGYKLEKWVIHDFIFTLKYSLWQILSVFSIYVMNVGVNYVFSFNHIRPEEIGLYNFSYRLFSGFSPFFALFGILIPKWIYNAEKEVIGRILKKKIVHSVLILTVLYFVVILLLYPFLHILGKENYIQSVLYFILLAPAFIFMSFVNLMNTVLMNTHFFKKAQFAIVVQSLAFVFFSVLFVYYYGVIGAIIATTLSFIVSSTYIYIYYFRHLKYMLIDVKYFKKS